MQFPPAIDANVPGNGLQMSVVIATRNRAEQLGQALDSLTKQSVPADWFEVVVVDNGSADQTEAVAENYSIRFPHWKFLRELKSGAAAARNTGIQACQAAVILFLDDDIVADRELLEQHLASHRERGAIAVLGGVRFPSKGHETPFFWALSRHPELFQSFQFSDPSDVPYQYFYTCNLSMLKAFFDQQSGFDEGFTASGFEDTELGYRFVRSGWRIVFNEKASALHNIQVGFKQFCRKRYSSGRWARYLVETYPELEETLLGSNSWKRKLSSGLGFLATPLGSIFDRCFGAITRPLLFPFGILCWHHLQYRFRAGFRAGSVSTAADLQENC